MGEYESIDHAVMKARHDIVGIQVRKSALMHPRFT